MPKKLLLSALLAFSQLAFAETHHPAVSTERIAPACVATFNDSVAQAPFTTAINLDLCEKQHASDPQYHGGLAGYQAIYHENDTTGTHGFYGYHLLGQTSSGIYVLNTYTSGGGSGVFTSLLLLKLDHAEVLTLQGKETYTRLSYVGNITGGDRCYDGLTDIQLEKNILSFKQYHGKTAVDCANPIAHSIDLTQIH